MGRLVNHGEFNQINSKMKLIKCQDGGPSLCLFSLRDIKKGEEILYSYGVQNLPWKQRQVSCISCILTHLLVLTCTNMTLALHKNLCRTRWNIYIHVENKYIIYSGTNDIYIVSFWSDYTGTINHK